MIPACSTNLAKSSGVHLKDSQWSPGSSAATAYILPAILKTRSSLHWTVSVVCGRERQYCRIQSMFMAYRYNLRGFGARNTARFDTAAYRWIGARQRIEMQFTIVLSEIPEGFAGVKNLRLEHGVPIRVHIKFGECWSSRSE